MPLLYIFLGGAGADGGELGGTDRNSAGGGGMLLGVKWHHCLALEAKYEFAKIKGFSFFK